MIDYAIRAEALIDQLVRDHGTDSARRMLANILEQNTNARMAFIDLALKYKGQVVMVEHLGKVR